MSVMVSALAALGAVYPDANPALRGTMPRPDSLDLRENSEFTILGRSESAGNQVYRSAEARERQYLRLLGAFPAIAAHFILRRSGSQPAAMAPLDPSNPFSYTEAYLMTMGLGRAHPDDARPHPKASRPTASFNMPVLAAAHVLLCGPCER